MNCQALVGAIPKLFPLFLPLGGSREKTRVLIDGGCWLSVPSVFIKCQALRFKYDFALFFLAVFEQWQQIPHDFFLISLSVSPTLDVDSAN